MAGQDMDHNIPPRPGPGGLDREEFLRRRARRNRAILAVLVGVVVLFYVLSIVRMGAS